MSMYRRPSCPNEARRRRHRFRQLLVESLETRSLLAADLLSGDLLYAGIADSSGSSTNPGLLMLVDAVSGSVAPWHAPFSLLDNSFEAVEGVSGLAFGPAGRLFGASSGGSASRVAEFDSATGLPVRPPVTIRAGAQLLNIFDLAAGPGAVFQLYGIGEPAGAGAGQIKLYLIDPGTGQATAVPDEPVWLSQLARAEGLAFRPDGTLYVTGLDAANGNPKLYVGDPQNWQTQPVVRSLSERVVGLDVRTVPDPAGGEIITLVGPIKTASNATTGGLMEINPDTGAFIRRVDQDLPTRGVAGDVAFYPDPESLTLRIEHEQDFEQGNGGYWADNVGGTIPGMWHYSTGRRSDRLINHTPIRNWYYGQFETSSGGGTYLTAYDHQGILNSPPIQVPECATTALSFSYLLGTREPLNVDFVEVRIQYVDDAGRPQTEVVLSRAAGTLPQTGNRWLTATADLSPFAGREVVVQFSFDTGDVPLVDPEGWYIDDVVVASLPQAVCGFKWQDENHNAVWDEGEPGLNGWTIYADTDGSGTFNPGQEAQTFYGAVDASGFAAGKQVRDAQRIAALSLSATGAPIWAMPNPAAPAGKVLAWGTAAGEEIWQLGRVLRVEFEPGVHTVSLDFAAVGPAPNARTVLEAFDRNHNRIGERSLVQSNASWQTLTVTSSDNEIAYVKATVDYGSVRLNNLQYWGTTAPTEGDPWVVTGTQGQREGAFSFDRLPLGTYAIREVLAEGWKQTSPGDPDFAHSVTVVAGQPTVGHWEQTESPNFGNFRPDISGYKWKDDDGDGVWDSEENEGLDNWTIELYLDVDGNEALGPVDQLVGTQQTAYDGQHHGAFWFAGLAPGKYLIREVSGTDWIQSYPTVPTTAHAVEVATDQPVVAGWKATQPPNFGNAIRPVIAVEKYVSLDGGVTWDDADSPPGPGVTQGTDPQFKFVVVNAGIVDLAGVVLSDPSVTGFTPPPPSTLAAGDGFVTFATGVWQPGQQRNVATARGSRGNATVSDSDDAFYYGAVPAMTLAKAGTFTDDDGDEVAEPTDGNGRADVGEVIQYTFTVSNAGNVPLTNARVADPDVQIVCPGGNPIPTLAPGDSQTCTGPYTITAADIAARKKDNTATADSDQTAPVTATATVTLPVPVLVFAKSGTFTDGNGNGRADAGELIQYTFTVSNAGNGPLTNVRVADPHVQIVCPGGNPIPTLAPGDSQTCTGPYAITAADIAARQKDNTATADSDQTAPVTATATVTLPVPVLVFAKSGTFTDGNGNGRADAGELIQYTLTVSNAGNGPLTNVSVADPDVQVVCPGGNPIPTLAPGDSQTCTGSYAITAADIAARKKDNTATADSDQTAPVTATATVTLPVPVLVFAKSGTFTDANGNGRADAGELIQYTLTVSNAGNGPLTNVSVADPDVQVVCPGGNPIQSLAPGNSQTCTGSYAITAADIAAGKKDNTATADSDQITPVTATATVTLPVPVLVFAKSGTFTDGNGNGRADAGELIQYTLTVSNAGNVPLTNVSVADPDVQIVCPGGNPIPTLAPGDSQTCTGSYAITAADIAAGKKDNTATADSDQTAPVTATATVTLPMPPDQPQVIQFITPMSVYRLNGLFEPVPPDSEGTVSIQGYLWHDVNQNGAWDTGEPGRAGWRIFLDLNGNNLYDAFDPADPSQPPEPFAVTGADGSYVFVNLPPGSYTIRVDRGGVSDGTFLVQRFPGPDPRGLRDDDEYFVDVQAGESVRGDSGVAEAPNFGSFEYSPLVRPADDQYGHLSLASSASRNVLLAALDPWQSFRVSNTTGSAFRITAISKDIDTSQIAVAAQFVTVYRKQLDGTLVPFVSPLEVASGETVSFVAFYDPAIRDGNQVLEQYPDWFGAQSQTNPAHTFAQGDHLTVITNAGKSFRFDLVGGSTYDSDIFYDAAVDRGDAGRLDDLLGLKTITGKQYIPDSDLLFDPTSDINARCPNGAAGDQSTCRWPLQGPPPREIGLGDFGPLNVESDRARAPFLDLDTDNSSGVRGTGYAAAFQGIPVRIADADVQFANSLERVLRNLSVTITHATEGDRLSVDESKLPAGITTTGNGTAQLTLAGNATVDEYAAALRWIRFSNSSSNSMDRTVEIDIRAQGSVSADSARAFTRLVDDRELNGNVTTARIIISAASFESWQNLANRYDVNGDQTVNSLDVLLIVNYLNTPPDSARLPPRPAGSYPFYDVNGDGICAPFDALLVINYLAVSQLAAGEGEAAELLAETLPVAGPLNDATVPAGALGFPAATANRIAVDVERDAGSPNDPVQNTVLPGASPIESPAVRNWPTNQAARWTPDAEEDLAGLDRAMFDNDGLLSDLAEDTAAVRFQRQTD